MEANEGGEQMTREEASRVNELLEQASLAKDSIKDTVRRIAREMPHLTYADVAEVARVRADLLYMKAAEQKAAADGARQILEIIKEVGAANLGECLQMLHDCKSRGDRRAAELGGKLDQALLLYELDSDNPMEAQL
jgi:flagellar motor switch protein FliG